MTKSRPKSYAVVLTFDGVFGVHCSNNFYDRYYDLIKRVDPTSTDPLVVRMHENPNLIEVRFRCSSKLAQVLHQWFNAILTEPAEEHLYPEKYE